MADEGFRESREADLYSRILVEAMGGPWAPLIKHELGPEFMEMCRVLYERQEGRLRRDPADLSADAIDWAAVRSLAEPTLRLYDDDEFHATTGHNLEELQRLYEIAVSGRREYLRLRHAISYAIGKCEVAFPTAYLEDRTYIAVVPDDDGWNKVVPECARDRRQEFLGPLREHFELRTSAHRWVELPVASSDDLEAWAATRRRRKPPTSRIPN